MGYFTRSRIVRHLALAFTLVPFRALAAITPSGDVTLAPTQNHDSLIGSTAHGTLRIDGGSILRNRLGKVGDKAGSTGAVTITGAGSQWLNSDRLFVGNAGSGELTIQAGAQVNSGDTTLGFEVGGVGSASVSGAGSGWAPVELDVGNLGSGSVVVAGGARLTSTGLSFLASAPGSSGSVAVAGASSIWHHGGTLYAGYRGAASLAVREGAELRTSTAYIGWAAGATGSARFSGAGTKWTNFGELYVGDGGAGSLTVEAGAQVTSGLAHIGRSGTASSSSASALITGTGSRWTVNGELRVSNGALGVKDGALVQTAAAFDLVLASSFRSTGSVTVSGPGSTLTARQTFVGHSGHGTLIIENGGQVVSTLEARAGYPATSSFGSVLITGAGSQWRMGRLLFDFGVLKVLDGGAVRDPSGSTFALRDRSTSYATISGPGSVWDSPLISIGSGSAVGNVNISDGASLTTGTLRNLNGSTVRFHVSGDGMLAIKPNGNVFNFDSGTMSFYADAFLPPGVYRPITRTDGTVPGVSGGTYTATGGVWHLPTRTFTVPAVTLLSAGDTPTLASAERLLFMDADSGQRAGASFRNVPAGSTFSATPLAPDALVSLGPLLPPDHQILTAWDFTTNLTSTEILLSFDVPEYASNISVWHLDNGTWTVLTPSLFTHASNDTVSFTATSFGSYALAAQVPEPAILVSVGACVALLREKRPRNRAIE